MEELEKYSVIPERVLNHFAKEVESRKTNLWEETISALKYNQKTWLDVDYIVAKPYEGKAFRIPKEEFESAAKAFNYDDGYGGVEVDMSLKIVGANWWLERFEYDGAEEWHFKTIPEMPNEVRHIAAFKKAEYTGDGIVFAEEDCLGDWPDERDPEYEQEVRND